MSDIRVRFAPSPTGTLHVGGARTALFNWLYARKQEGTFVLRIEDTDQERSTAESYEQILRSMRWLGLDWDEGPGVGGDHGPYLQTERNALYKEYGQKLLDEGLGYPCFCSPEELEARREAAMESGGAVGYDGRCRSLSDADRSRLESEGKVPVLRVRTPDEGVTRWRDIVHGDMEFQNDVLDDWVAFKGDGQPTYNFAVVVDDGLMKISHVLRGDDHVSNTPRQIHLFRAFDFRVPKFGHMPMILGADKQRLSKRHGAASVEDFRDEGYLPEALVNYLALLGWSPGNDREVFTVAELIKAFSLKRMGNTPAVFDPEKCRFINAEHMKQLDLDQKVGLAMPWLIRGGLAVGDDEPTRLHLRNVLQVMGNRFGHLGDVAEHLSPYFSDEYPVDVEGVAVLEGTAERLSALADRYEALDRFDAGAVEEALRTLAGELGVKAGELIHPARFAVTGQTAGPSVFDAIAAVGPERAVARLRSPRTV